jgi:hypothetical protein
MTGFPDLVVREGDHGCRLRGEDQFRPSSRIDRSVIRKQTLAGTQGNGQHAPIRYLRS